MTQPHWPELDRALHEAGRTRGWLASELAINRRTLLNWERRGGAIGARRIAAVAAALGVPPAELAPGDTSDPRMLAALPGEWEPHCQLLEPGAPGPVPLDVTDAPALVGAVGRASPLTLWLDRTDGATPPVTGEATWTSRIAEFARCDLEHQLDRPIRTVGPLASRAHPWLSWQSGALFADDPATVILISPDGRPRRGRPVPNRDHLRAQAAMAATGATHAVIAMIDRERTVAIDVPADPATQEAIIALGEELWQHICEHTRPPIDWATVTDETLERLYRPDLAARKVVLDSDGAAAGLIAKRHRIDAAMKDLADERRDVDNRLRALLGDRAVILDDRGRTIAELRAVGVREDRLAARYPVLARAVSVDVPVLDEQALKRDHPDVYAEMCATEVVVVPPDQADAPE